MIRYETKRLIIRDWLDSDIPHYIALNLDPHALRYFPRVYQKDESIADVIKFQHQLKIEGYTIYACELKSDNSFIGFVGLNKRTDMPFSPCIEIGWRLLQKYWGKGYAPEAAKKCLEVGFNDFLINEIVAFTPKINLPSIRVMQKIGMHYIEEDDFHHYKLTKDHQLSLHVLYKITNQQFQSQQRTEI